MPKRVIKFNHRDNAGRELILISVDDFSEIFPLPERENSHFVLFLAMDGRKSVAGDLGNIPGQLLKEGLVYLCSWGPDCSRVHDIFDEEIVLFEEGYDKDATVMTTWHENDSIEEALWFLLFCAIPEDEFYDKCKTAFVISVGNSEWAKRLENGLSDIDRLNDRVAV